MNRQQILAWVVGASQLALGVGFLFLPDLFFAAFGFTPAAPDQKYLFGQLAARFFAYGIGMFVIARNPAAHRPWWLLMALIQAIDLAVGVYYTALGLVTIEASAFPMFNAAVFLALLLLWAPRPVAARQGQDAAGEVSK